MIEEISEKSDLASARLQLAPSMLATLKEGITPVAINPRECTLEEMINIESSDAKFYLFGKIATGFENIEEVCLKCINLAINANRNKIKVLTTYCDSWCDYTESIDNDSGPTERTRNKAISSLYKNLMYLSDYAIYPCKSQQESAKKWTKQKCTSNIIIDPLQYKQQPFLKINAGEEIRLIWIGHYSNFIFLEKALKMMMTECNTLSPFKLDILTRAPKGLIDLSWAQKILTKTIWTVAVHKWSNEKAKLYLKNAHISLLPSDINCARKSASSHSRAIDSINSGCLTIASPIRSYVELSECLILGYDFAKMLDDIVERYNEVSEEVKSTRKIVLGRFSSEVNAKNWSTLIRGASR